MAQKQQQQVGSFSQAFRELERIVREFEQGDLELEDGILKFKEALSLAEMCKKRLDEVENKVITLKEQFADFSNDSGDKRRE